jgi:hypothetical protein
MTMCPPPRRATPHSCGSELPSTLPLALSSLMVLQDGTVTMCKADWDAQAPLATCATTASPEIK